MPVYDYLCDHCGHAFSATGGFNDPPLAACPQCGAVPRRLIGATAIVFKGSGWYKTDSRSAPKDGGDAKPAATGASGDKDKGQDQGKEKGKDKGKDEGKDNGKGEGKKGSAAGDGKPAEPKPAVAAPAKSESPGAAPAKSKTASTS